jgi:hypothetical protein
MGRFRDGSENVGVGIQAYDMDTTVGRGKFQNRTGKKESLKIIVM